MLHAAVLAKRQQADKLRYLLAKLPPVKELQRWWDWCGYNPLHRAVDQEALDAIRMLVEAGLDVNGTSAQLVPAEDVKAEACVGSQSCLCAPSTCLWCWIDWNPAGQLQSTCSQYDCSW